MNSRQLSILALRWGLTGPLARVLAALAFGEGRHD